MRRPGARSAAAASEQEEVEQEGEAQAMTAETESILRAIVAQGACREERHVTADAMFDRDLGMDSLDLIEASMQIEDRFDIIVTDDDIRALEKFGDLVALVDRKARVAA